jgi:hypothetical protein
MGELKQQPTKEAIADLVAYYQFLLEQNPDLIESEWLKHTNEHARIEARGDESVLVTYC